MSEEKKKPVERIRIGRIVVPIWENASKDNGTFFSTGAAERLYKDGEETKASTSLSRSDLPVAAEALRKAGDWIDAREAERQEQKVAA